MPRSLWKGAISFGLVNIPVRMYAATSSKDLKFHYLHERCGTPVRYVKMCPTCDSEVTQDEIVMGYEFAPREHVILTDEDFERIPLATTKTIDIVDFVNLTEIDPIYFNKSYYLEPFEGGTKAYGLLRRAMEIAGRIGVAKVVLRTKEVLAAVRVLKDGLALETMHWPDEIRPMEEIPGITRATNILGKEMDMAVHLIENLSVPFRPEQYQDEYRRAISDVIERKIEGREIRDVPVAPAAGRVLDLMAALEASLRATSDGKGTDRASVGAVAGSSVRKAKRTRKAGDGPDE